MITLVRHARSCGNIASFLSFHPLDKLDHPIITNIGVSQAILLGQHIISNNYDRCFASPSIRTIMTALLSLRNIAYNNTTFKIEINPYLIEENEFMKWYYIAVTLFFTDRQNAPVGPKNLKQMIKLVKKWLYEEWLLSYDDIEFEETIKNSTMKELQKEYLMLKKIILQAREKYDINLVITAKKLIKEFQEKLKTGSIKELQKFGDPRYLKGSYVDMAKYEILYMEVVSDNFFTNGFAPMYKFIEFIRNEKVLNGIAFSHGSILHHTFEKYNWKQELNSILNNSSLFNTSAFTFNLNTNIVAPLYPILGTSERTKFDNINMKHSNDLADCRNPQLLNKMIKEHSF